MKDPLSSRIFIRTFALLAAFGIAVAKEPVEDQKPARTINGYKGIWFDLGQSSEFGSKYSGGLGTYTAKHLPLAVHAPAARKTFFVYGGTTRADARHLLAMVSYYDHRTKRVPKPVVVHDKQGVDDPHDNPSLQIDGAGHLWVFVSGRGSKRPGHVYRSRLPYDIESFEHAGDREFTYPQPWWIDGKGFVFLFTKYTGTRGSARNHGYVRRPVNAHPEFYGFWADGNTDALSESHLYFTDRSGETVWCLPYDMDGETSEPKPLYPKE